MKNSIQISKNKVLKLSKMDLILKSTATIVIITKKEMHKKLVFFDFNIYSPPNRLYFHNIR